jgi:excisionase family DNA binding protein
MSDALNKPLTIKEAADALGLSVHTIRAWIGQRRLKHVRLGRAIRILPSAVAEMLSTCTVEAVQDSSQLKQSSETNTTEGAKRKVQGNTDAR